MKTHHYVILIVVVLASYYVGTKYPNLLKGSLS